MWSMTSHQNIQNVSDLSLRLYDSTKRTGDGRNPSGHFFKARLTARSSLFFMDATVSQFVEQVKLE